MRRIYMNKKIKTLVQKYEKDMQFENRFDELKDKLDLIPDEDIKSEVFTIKRKVMPAYVMMIVLLMLVTGIIGLQFGLNSSFVIGPEKIDHVEEQLAELMDIYEREAVYTQVVSDDLIIHLYVGQTDLDKIIVIRLVSKIENVSIVGNANGGNLQQSNGTFYASAVVIENIVNLNIDFVSNNIVIGEVNTTIDLTSYYLWLLG